MQKFGLKITAAVVAGLMGLVWFAGLDDLPRDVRAQIAAERTALSAAQKTVAGAKEEVARDRSSEPALFGALPSAALYGDRLSRSETVLGSASRDMEQLARLEKADRRSDADQAKQILQHLKQTRTAATAEAEAVRKDADHWVELKKHLPDEVRDMERDYQAVHAVDLAGITALVQK